MKKEIFLSDSTIKRPKTRAFRLLIFIPLLLAVLAVSSFLPQRAEAATGNDYCVLPPFIVGGVTPNLLMMIDNSKSMYDLNYIDKGTATRTPYYCYDETYRSGEPYTGYFDRNSVYEYNFGSNYFAVSAAAFPAACSKLIAGELCIDIDTLVTPNNVTRFVARGNYLNWLSASKFDVQKSILTGGVYRNGTCSVTAATLCQADSQCPAGETCIGYLDAESRGCVGRKFLKEAITGNFVDYNDGAVDPNVSLGITFGVRGPENPLNATALSLGGQTYIDIFQGDYQQEECQEAIDLLADPTAQKQDVINAIDLCLNNAATNKKNCEFDTRFPKPVCNADSPDCINVAGTCLFAVGGVCSTTAAGVCGLLPANTGVCTANNGTGCSKLCVGGTNAGAVCNNNGQCNSNLCSRVCIDGGKAGAACNNVADCAFSSCSAPASKLGQACSTNANCDVKTCTAGKPNTTACAVNADCNVQSCTAGLIGTACTVNTDCNANYCNTGPFSPLGLGIACAVDADCGAGRTCVAGSCAGQCSSNWECSTNYGHCLAPPTTQVKSTFTQSMHSCYQLTNKGQDVGPNEVQQVSNPAGCSQIFSQVKTCQGGSKDGASCSVLADCPGAAACIGGPSTIRPGSPVLLCGSAYAGYCANSAGPAADPWSSTSWVAREYSSADECILTKYREFCGAVNVPPVVDPTDAPSDTTQYSNLPAIINDIGLEAQLGVRIGSMTVDVKRFKVCIGGTNPGVTCAANADCNSNVCSAEPRGVLQDFATQIRMGVMTFNSNGTATECNTYCSNNAATACLTDANCVAPGKCVSPVPCPKVCSSNALIPCTTVQDCPGGDTCDPTVRNTTNLDGAAVIHPIGAANGDHSTGLIKAVDDIQATSWTPFAEAFYNAIGYYARTNSYTVTPGTSRSDLRINATDFDANNNPSQYVCQANNVLLISDGSSTADRHSSVNSLASLYNDGDGQITTALAASNACPQFGGSKNIDDLAWLAKHRNIKTFTTGAASNTPPANLSEAITSYVVYTGVDDTANPGECNPKTLMNQTAVNGGTSLYNPQDPETLRTDLSLALQNIAAKSASGTAASVLASGEGSGANLVQAVFFPSRNFAGTDIIWTGVMQNLWYFVDPRLGNSSIREDSTSDAALRLSQDCIVQYFFDTATNETKANLFADLNSDGVADGAGTCPRLGGAASTAFDSIRYLWETGSKLFNRTAASRTIYANLNADNTTTTLTPFNDTAAATVTSIRPFLNLPAAYNDNTNAAALINYVRGVDGGTFEGSTTRNRTVTIGGVTNTWKLGDIINSTPKIMSWIPLNTYDKTYADTTYEKFLESKTYKSRGVVFAGGNDGMLHAFEMGNLVIYNEADRKASLATQRLCTINDINNYNGVSPSWKCTSDADCPSGETCPATSTVLGSEIWGFIPKHSLPYLRYMADPSYCHLFYIDATPYIFDASIKRDATDAAVTADATCEDDASSPNAYWNCLKTKKSWRTVLIGSMRTGGACANTGSTCTECVKTPANDLGYSSYFALDVTDPYHPTLLWEFANPNLGFSTSGPAIVRTGPSDKNGRWFAVFASGPMGYVSKGSHQMLGVTGHGYESPDQEGTLKLYVVDIKTGDLIRTINSRDRAAISETSAFAGSLLNSTFDADLDYSDDALYFGYTERDESFERSATAQGGTASSITLDNFASGTDDYYKGMFAHASSHETRLITGYNGTTKVASVDSAWEAVPAAGSGFIIIKGWTKGGVMRVITNESMNPDNWTLSKVIDGIGPVTSAVTRLRNNKDGKVRLFFGSGRYFYKVNDLIDDKAGLRKVYGLVEPCFTGSGASPATDPTCTAIPPTMAAVTEGSLGNADTAAGSADANGWYIELDASDGNYGAERVMTDPLASTIGVAFYTTNKPSADVCSYGGVTHLWAVRYDTGGEVPAGILKGKAILQLSTGSIEEINMATAFKDAVVNDPIHRGNRRSIALQGVPPTGQGLSIIVPPKPVDTILHIRKR